MTDFIDDKIHYLNIDSDGIELPSEFTFPFHYTPHPLTVKAAHEVQNYIASRTDWTEELSYMICYSQTVSSASKKQTFLQSTNRLRNWKVASN